MASNQGLLLHCLEASERTTGDEGGWVSAARVARELNPAADPQRVGWELTHLERLGLVEACFERGTSYYRCSQRR
jgi:hypothetical protein